MKGKSIKVKVVFKSEIYFEGDSMKDIVSQWDKVELFSDEANEHYACQQSVIRVEEENGSDVTNEFNKY